MEKGLSQVAAMIVAAASEPPELSGGSKGRTAFQWGGTISAILLLILNRTGRRSSKHTSLLVLFLFTSFPTALFKILRGQLGCWVAFLAVAANLFFPQDFPVSRFVLFVITPDWLADGLRDSIAGGVFCLVIGLLLVIMEIGGVGICNNWDCNLQCGSFWFAIFFLFLYTISYLGFGPW